MTNLKVPLQLPSKYWMPLLSAVVLAFICSDLMVFESPNVYVGFMISDVGNRLYIAASIIMLVTLAIRHRDSRPVWWALDTIVCNTILVQLVKYLSAMPRPSGNSSGFPSGHTSLAFALAWLCLETRPRLAPLWFALAIAIGWSRVETDKHFSYQVIAGAVIGTLCAWLATHTANGVLFPRILHWRRERTPSETV